MCIAKTRFWPGDRVSVHGSSAIVRSGPDSKGYYEVVFLEDGFLSGPIPSQQLKLPAGDKAFPVGEEVGWKGLQGVILTSSFDGRYVVLFDQNKTEGPNQAPSIGFLPRSELRTPAKLRPGDEVVVYGDVAVVESNSDRDGLYHVVFVHGDGGGEASYPVPEFALHPREPGFDVGAEVFVDQNASGIVVYGPDEDWNYLLRFANGTISGPIPEARLSTAFNALGIGASVSVRGEQGIIVAGPDDHGHFSINLRSGKRLHGVAPNQIHELQNADEADSNPFLRVQTADLRAAHEAAEDVDYDPLLAAEHDSQLLRIEGEAEKIAQRVFRLSNSPAEAGRAARKHLEDLGGGYYGLEEVEEMACRAAARAVLLDSPKSQPIGELVAIARAAALAAGLTTRRGERAHLSAVAEAVAKSGGDPKIIGVATLSASAVLVAEDTEELKLVGRAAAYAAARSEAQKQLHSASSVGNAAMEAAKAVGLKPTPIKTIAARAASQALLEELRFDNNTKIESVASSLRDAGAVTGLSQHEGQQVAVSVVQTWMAEKQSNWDFGMKLLASLDASDVGSLQEALLQASKRDAEEVAKRREASPELVASSAAWAGRWEALELDPVTIASIAARAVAVASVRSGHPPTEVARHSLAAAASVSGISTDKAALIAALAATQAVLKAMVLVGSSARSMAAAGKKACSVAGLPEHDQSRIVAWAGAHMMVLTLLGSGIDLTSLGRRSKDLAEAAGLSEGEASILAGEALAKSIFRTSIDDGDEPEEIAAAVGAAFASTNVSSTLRTRLSTSLLAELSSQDASRKGFSAARVGMEALRYAQATRSPDSIIFAEAAAAAAAAAARRSAQSGARAEGVASAAKQAAEGAKSSEEKAKHIAAAAAASALAWNAAEQGKTFEEIGSLAFEAANSTDLSLAEAKDLAADAAAPAAVAAAFARGPASKVSLREAATSALKGAGVREKYRVMRAARAVARDVTADAAMEAWGPKRITQAALFGVNTAGLLCRECSAPVASVVATAVARSSLEKGLSSDEVAAATKTAMDYFWKSHWHSAVSSKDSDTALEVANLKTSDAKKAVREAIFSSLEEQDSPAKLGLHGEQAIEALLRKVFGEARGDLEARQFCPSASLAATLVAKVVAEEHQPPAAVTYAALAAAEAAGGAPGGSEATVRLAAAAAAEAVVQENVDKSPEIVGQSALAVMRAAGLTPSAERLAGLKSDPLGTATAAEVAAMAVMRRRWTDTSTEGSFPNALEAAKNATRAAGEHESSVVSIVGRVAARLAAKREGGSPFDLRRAKQAAETAALAAGLPPKQAKAEAILAADLAGEQGNDADMQIFMLSDTPDDAADDALLFAKPHTWGEALQVPSSSSFDDPLPWAAPPVNAANTSSGSIWLVLVGLIVLVALTLPALVLAAILFEKMRTSSPSDVRTLNRFCCASHQTYTAHYSALDLSCQSNPNQQISSTIASTRALDWYPHAKFRGRRLVVVLENANLDAAIQLSRHTGSLGDQDRRNFAEFSIAYFAVAALLDSELQRSGYLLIYILSVRGELIEVNPHCPLPPTPQRFARLVAEALSKGSAGSRGSAWALLTSCSTTSLLSALPSQSRKFRCTTTNYDQIRPVVQASGLRDYVITEEQLDRQVRRNRSRREADDKETSTLPAEVPVLVAVPCGLDPRLATKFDEEEKAQPKDDVSEGGLSPVRQSSKSEPHLPIGMQPLYLDVQRATLGGGDPSAALCRKVCETFSDFWRPLPPPAYPWSPIATFAETWLFYEP